jgi:hypothetical protein
MTDDKPTTLRAIFAQDDLDRITTAVRDQQPNAPILDELGVEMNPASAYSRWLDALGLRDLARRANWELASDPTGVIGQALEMGRADPADVRPLRKPVQEP